MMRQAWWTPGVREQCEGLRIILPDLGECIVEQARQKGVLVRSEGSHSPVYVPLRKVARVLRREWERWSHSVRAQRRAQAAAVEDSLRSLWEILPSWSTDWAAELSVAPPTLDESDAQLIAVWDGQERDHIRGIRPVDTSGRLATARGGEKAAMEVLSRLGCTVVDVSRTQLDSPSTGDWLTHDLVVDGVAIDVKTARQWERNAPEIKVSSFKLSRGSEPVEYLGVLARIRRNQASPGESLREFTILGRYSPKHVDRFSEWASQGGINLGAGITEGRFLARWLFDAATMVGKRYPVGASAAHVGDILVSMPAAERPLPVALRAWVLKQDDRLVTGLPRVARRFGDHLRRCGFQKSRSLWSIVGAALATVLEEARAGGTEPILGQLREALYAGRGRAGVTYPLGVPDPSCVVCDFLDALDALWTSARHLLPMIKSAEITETGIVVGRLQASSQRKSLLAYCGKCGTYPLIAGRERSCKRGLLICQCGFCCKPCAGQMDVSGAELDSADR